MLSFSQVQVRRSFSLLSQGDQLCPPLWVDIVWARVPWLALISRGLFIGVETQKLKKRKKKISSRMLFQPDVYALLFL
jgi:hypothetical protein